MKNPHITNTLVQIMKSDRAVKLELIECIIIHNKENNPLYNEVNGFDTLYELTIAELTQIVNGFINDAWASILQTVSNRRNPEDDNC